DIHESINADEYNAVMAIVEAIDAAEAAEDLRDFLNANPLCHILSERVNAIPPGTRVSTDIPAVGNCGFEAVGRQTNRTASSLRRETNQLMCTHSDDFYEDPPSETVTDYTHRMSFTGVFCEDRSIAAMAILLQRDVVVYVEAPGQSLERKTFHPTNAPLPLPNPVEIYCYVLRRHYECIEATLPDERGRQSMTASNFSRGLPPVHKKPKKNDAEQVVPPSVNLKDGRVSSKVTTESDSLKPAVSLPTTHLKKMIELLNEMSAMLQSVLSNQPIATSTPIATSATKVPEKLQFNHRRMFTGPKKGQSSNKLMPLESFELIDAVSGHRGTISSFGQERNAVSFIDTMAQHREVQKRAAEAADDAEKKRIMMESRVFARNQKYNAK
ncbi:hypothetical protein HDU80_003420, partial [Chytriomyces hyalinus]